MLARPGWSAGLWVWIADLSVRRSRWILLVTTLVTGICAWGLVGVGTETDLEAFVRPEARELIETIEQDFDEGSQLTLIFEAVSDRSLLEPELLKRQLAVMEAIHERFDVTTFSLVEGIDRGLRRVKRQSLHEIEDYTPIAEALLGLSGPRTVRDLAQVSRHLVSHPDAVLFYAKLRLVGVAGLGMEGPGADKTSYNVPYVKAAKAFVRLDAGYSAQESKRALQEIPRLGMSIGGGELAVYATNDKLNAYELDDRSREHAYLLGLVALFVDTLCIWLLFRSRSELGIVLFILALSAVWSFGIAALLGMRFSFFHLVALPILLGTGIDDTFVFGRRFREERARAPVGPALRNTFGAVGNAIALTTCTTLIAFLMTGLTATNEITRSFFQFVALSMAVIFLLSTFLQGALRAELAARGSMRAKVPRASVFDAGSRALVALAAPAMLRNRAVLIASSLIFALALGFGLRVRGEAGPNDMVRPGMQTYDAQQMINRHFSESRVGYVLFEGQVENPALLMGLANLHEELRNEPTIEQVLGRASVSSVVDLLEKLRVRIHPGLDVRAAFDRLAEDERTADYVLDRTFAESLTHVARRNGDAYDALLLRFNTVGGTETQVQAAASAIERQLVQQGLRDLPGVEIRLGGGDAVYGLEALVFTQTLMWIFAASLVSNWIVLLLVWRRMRISLIAMAPVVLAVTCLLGLMGALDVPLAIMSVTVGAIAAGLGIDYPIHLIERFEEERLRHHRSPAEAARASLVSMGPHILASALTTIFGFGAACVLALPMAVSFGVLTGASIILVYLASLFVLPALLIRSAEHGSRSEAEEGPQVT